MESPIQTNAYEAYKKLKDIINVHASSVYLLGSVLLEIKENKYYKNLDNVCENFEDFLADPDLGFSRRTAFYYMQVYDYFGRKLGVSETSLRGTHLTKLLKIKKIAQKEALGGKNEKEVAESLLLVNDKDFYLSAREKGHSLSRPQLYLDEVSGKYIFEFEESQVLRIVNKTKNEITEIL